MNLGQTILTSMQEFFGDKVKGSSKRLAGSICIILVAAMVICSLIPPLHYKVDMTVLDALLWASGSFFGIDAVKQIANKYNDKNQKNENTTEKPNN